MIFDRTQNDVDASIRIRREKVQTFQMLTEAEIETLEKGMLTINTINRIEDKQAELKSRLVESGHSFFNIESQNWSQEDIFDESNFNRIVKNLDVLKDVLGEMKSTPKTPEAIYYFQNINDIEKILFDLDFLLDNAQKNINFAWAIGTADTGLNFTS